MLEVALLGQFEVRHTGERLAIPTRNAQALLAYLILTAGQTHRRERLAGLLWPDSLDEAARGNLRHELWRLRKALEPAGSFVLLVDDLNIAFNPQTPHELDVRTLESTPVEDGNAEELMAALSAYGGELLPGFYQEWVFAERERLRAAYESRMARLLELLEERGRWSEVVEWSTRWVAAGEWPEAAYRALMTAYASMGDASKAVSAYERLAQGLQKDMGLKPSEQTQAVYRRVQAGWKPGPHAQSAAPVQMPPPEMAAPAVYRPVPRSNLPVPLTSFVGREHEIEEVTRLASSARLVTIAGPGGAGKTRLSIEVARGLAPAYADGAFWVELAPLWDNATANGATSDPAATAPGYDLVVQAVAKSLRVPELPGWSLIDSLTEFSRDRQILIILDNCEHLIAACAAVAEHLLAHAPSVSLLTTSREPLAVPGEKVWHLSSLSLPSDGPADRGSIARSEAVRLFIERATDIAPAFAPTPRDLQAIAQICIRLDGIPLAIELAAARMAMLSAEEIASRLDSRFSLLTGGRRTAMARHQTLHAAIEWSYDLLSETEQVLFRRLSIFAASLTLEAAEAICADEQLPRDEVLSLLGRLVDKSLLQVTQARHDPDLATRYRMLDTICTFGQLKLADAGEDRLLRDRHASYYVALIETAEPELYFQYQTPWFKVLRAEYDNLRAAIDWSIENDHAEFAARLVSALTWFWFSDGSIREGLDITHRVLAQRSTFEPTIHRARALNTATYLHWMVSDMGQVRPMVEEALSILQTAGYEDDLAWTLQLQGLVLSAEGSVEAAHEVMSDSVDQARKLGNARSNLTLGVWGDIFDDQEKARQIYHQSAEILRALGNYNFAAYPTRRLGYLALARGEMDKARAYLLDSLATNYEVGDRRGVIACLISMAAYALRTGYPRTAARLYGVVEREMDWFGTLMPMDQRELERVRERLREGLDGASCLEEIAIGRAMSEAEGLELVARTFGRSGEAVSSDAETDLRCSG